MTQLSEEQQEQVAKKIAALFVVDINDLEPYTELVRNKIAECLPLPDSDSQAASGSLTGFGKPEDEARRILTYARDWIGDANYRVLHTEIVKSIAGLYGELDQVQKERDDLRVVVDVATDDDPGTALSKLHKIQYDAATTMRDKCVEKVKALAESWEQAAYAWHDKAQGESRPDIRRIQYEERDACLLKRDAANVIANNLSSLTLDQVKPGEM